MRCVLDIKAQIRAIRLTADPYEISPNQTGLTGLTGFFLDLYQLYLVYPVDPVRKIKLHFVKFFYPKRRTAVLASGDACMDIKMSLSEFPVNFNKTALDLALSVHGTAEHFRGTKIIGKDRFRLA